MKFNLKRAIIGLCLLFLICPFAYAETWQETLKSHFDIAETFDELNDWDPTSTSAGSKYSDLPQLSGGGASMWGYYADWIPGDKNVNWIADFGTDYRTGPDAVGKSLKMDVPQLGSVGSDLGPTRFGLYFGSGSASSGYSEIYLFYRFRFPTNAFPRGTYFSYYKFNHLGTGYTSIDHWNGRSNSECKNTDQSLPCRAPYGGHSMVTKIGNGDSRQYNLCLEGNDYTTSANTPLFDRRWGDIDVPLGTWAAIEYHAKLADSPNSDSVEIWIYDSNGNAYQSHSMSGISLHNVNNERGHKFNYFFFGGNKDFEDAGIDSTYYVDDFIIDDQRIGEKYFQLLNNGTLPNPYCGDGTCNNSETCSTCSADCGNCQDTLAPVAPKNLRER